MKNILAISYSDLGSWDGQTRNLTKLQGEGRMVRKMPTPKSDQVTLYAFARWLASSKRSFIGQANINVSERNPKTVYPWF